jgi:hypothetical protein
MPNQSLEPKAESAQSTNTALAASQPQTGQPDHQPSTHDKGGTISPLFDVTFNPPGISTTQYSNINIKQAYGQMLDGFKSPGGSHINMDALMC